MRVSIFFRRFGPLVFWHIHRYEASSPQGRRAGTFLADGWCGALVNLIGDLDTFQALWDYHDGPELATAVHYAFVKRMDPSHGETSKKTLAGSTGCGPPKLGEIGKAEADAGYSKSMALLLAT